MPELTDEDGSKVYNIMGDSLLQQRLRRTGESSGTSQLRAEAQDRLVRKLPQRTPDGETTRGRAMRVKFLARNGLFLLEVKQARSAFGIPENEISIDLEGPRWDHFISGLEDEGARDLLAMAPDLRTRVGASQLVGAFLLAHDSAYKEEAYRPDQLPEDLYDLAVKSAAAHMDGRNIPEWLRPKQKGMLRSASPIRRAISTLLHRHRLPGHAWQEIELFFFTKDLSWLGDITDLELSFQPSSGAVENEIAFDVLIKGVDEFTTRKEWDRLWDSRVKGEIEHIWGLRGQNPRGKRSLTDDRVERFFEFWCDRKVRGWDFDYAFKHTSVDLADALQKTVRDADREIDIAFSPADLRDDRDEPKIRATVPIQTE